MSILVGPISGALVAGGVYYGFSSLINSRTEQHRIDLHKLSSRLVDAPTFVPAPPSAASRIHKEPFSEMLQARWNDQIGAAFDWVRASDRRLENWTHRLLYGEDQKSS
ncbi:hypothetical protein CYLTODRAFT_389274 [Cylindrobasidium torrendii FP15055 ss-10]|uniref:MICOS complex subunit MIC12 n=1 Tax=Cylindrobasidium torrendii FP15055 ss-10 TaxID=1314674 RepID=A0A0D7BR35_9AGAR|nr:hypothetical protein CYLTODRAFT_389274 [Cylindrobasidium torrendii FP15055 ss-10]